MEQDRPTVPRGRHAPPLEVRQDAQRQRLFRAAAVVFARSGYAEASAEAIAREAGMSKATFYEHFDNKEEAMLALFDAAAATLGAQIAEAAERAGDDPVQRLRASIHSLFDVLIENPNEAQTLMVEIIGAGPRAVERRDKAMEDLATALIARRAAAPDTGPRYASWHDAFAVVGAIAELASRQLRRGEPADIRELEPVVERLVVGVLLAADQPASALRASSSA